MADESTVDGSAQSAASQPVQTPPQQQPVAPQHNPGQGTSTGTQVLDALNALPEKIVKGLSEVMAASKPQPQPQQQATAQAASAEAAKPEKKESSTPQKKNFAQWWFGS